MPYSELKCSSVGSEEVRNGQAAFTGRQLYSHTGSEYKWGGGTLEQIDNLYYWYIIADLQIS